MLQYFITYKILFYFIFVIAITNYCPSTLVFPNTNQPNGTLLNRTITSSFTFVCNYGYSPIDGSPGSPVATCNAFNSTLGIWNFTNACTCVHWLMILHLSPFDMNLNIRSCESYRGTIFMRAVIANYCSILPPPPPNTAGFLLLNQLLGGLVEYDCAPTYWNRDAGLYPQYTCEAKNETIGQWSALSGNCTRMQSNFKIEMDW